MIIESNKTEISELSGKILDGLTKALYKMAEKAAANNENLIIGNKDGSVKSVPAKELLKTLSK
jgi:hypothetical protein